MADFSENGIITGSLWGQSDPDTGPELDSVDVTGFLTQSYQSTLDEPGENNCVVFYVPNSISPQITNIVPAPGSILSKNSTITFDVTDDSGLALVEVQVDQAQREVVHDGDDFVIPYLGSSRTIIDLGYTFTVVRTGGWTGPPTFRVRALDTSLNDAT
jgi:hypothetical protein